MDFSAGREDEAPQRRDLLKEDKLDRRDRSIAGFHCREECLKALKGRDATSQ